MRTSTLLTAAFAGVALSSPLVKRDTVLEIDTVVDVVYVTEILTETAGAPPATAATVAAATTEAEVTSTVAPTTSTLIASSSTPVAKSFYEESWSWSSAWTSTYAASSVAVSSVSVATSSSSVYVAPSSSETPTTSSATSSAAEVSLSITSTPSVASGAVKTSSSLYISSPPLTTRMAVLAARSVVPTCNANNVAIVTSAKPNYSAFCTNWKAAATHSAPVTVTGLTNKQISNICNCLQAPTYVASPALKMAKTTSTAATAAVATTYQQIVLAHHNVHRANHSASALTWSDSLASTASSIAAVCVYAHNITANGGGYGQNIAAGVPASNVSMVISDLFYNGEVNNFVGLYGQANPSMANFENWGHFSQLVWKATTQVGCATHDCSASGLANTGNYVSPYFTVCNYASPGNYGGQYGSEIGEPLNKATVNWSYDL